MSVHKGWLLVGFFFLNGIVFADEVTELLKEALVHKAQQSCQYGVKEIYEYKGKREEKISRVLQKGGEELHQAQNGELELRVPGSRMRKQEEGVVVSQTLPEVCSFLLKEYKEGRVRAEVKEKEGRILLKGKRADIRFEVEFSKKPVVVLSIVTEDDDGFLYRELNEYDFSKKRPVPVKTSLKSAVYRLGKKEGVYEKTYYYTDYVETELSEEDVSTHSVKENVFKKLKIGRDF